MIKIKEEFKLPTVLGIGLLLVFVETVGSFFSGSLSLLSHAGLMLAASFAALPAIIGKNLNISKEEGEAFKRSQFYSICLNGVMLLIIALYIIYKAVVLFADPVGINLAMTCWMAFSAFTGLAFCLLLLYPEIKKNKDIKTLFIKYALCAALMPLIASASAIYYLKDMYFFDPVLSLFIAAFIIVQVISLLKQALLALIK
ncbi:MAG: cation transporter [Endomicrobium sp.]|jgi:cobalt-zinc-cadmium efflux system protein|nr:cation transporter [Endomicrobium sp.]